MASVEKTNADSEMEEGEIVDDLDDLSDISSEEEFLLRQRLQVLENYNNVLERKKAKNLSLGRGKHADEDIFLQDVSELSATDSEDIFSSVRPKSGLIVYRHIDNQKHLKPHHKTKKKRKGIVASGHEKPKENKKKVHRKKKLQLKVISETSEESDDEYRNKRRKLANAVSLDKSLTDKSSLQDRLKKMLGVKMKQTLENILIENQQTETESHPKIENICYSPITSKESSPCRIDITSESEKIEKSKETCSELIDLCTDDDAITDKNSNTVRDEQPPMEKLNSEDSGKGEDICNKKSDTDSDEDLELLRQHALKSKAQKTEIVQKVPIEQEKPISLSDDEDSDTAELRLICLKSALLKKAIEMKQKQKLRKKLSQSSCTLEDDPLDEYMQASNTKENGNNTDTESVDMDIGSDADEKAKDSSQNAKVVTVDQTIRESSNTTKQISENGTPKDDELEDDEDLLRAKLLTSLSKNLPNLVNPKVVNTTEVEKPKENTPPVPKTKIPENRIVINLGESDSEGEHEATKNLTKMHMKLSEQVDFQQKLDMFLKSTRMEVEKQKLPDVVQNPTPPEKFVAKTVNHLPKPEQIEYKNLVKKMAELEKIKQARQSAMNLMNHTHAQDMLKTRSVTIDTTRIVAINKLEEQVAMSRKRIAEESARMLKLKEEATKLSQKYKIVANELKNISTAITLNKKEQRTVQNRLTKVRLHHQRLLTGSQFKYSEPISNNILTVNRPNILQNDSKPKDEIIKNPQPLPSVKVSVANDRLEEPARPNGRLSVQVDVVSNKKTVCMPDAADGTDVNANGETKCVKDNARNVHVDDKGGGIGPRERVVVVTRPDRRKEFDDYESPLQALERDNWEADPNGILCPFEVGGNCKDPDCKYLHPKLPSH